MSISNVGMARAILKIKSKSQLAQMIRHQKRLLDTMMRCLTYLLRSFESHIKDQHFEDMNSITEECLGEKWFTQIMTEKKEDLSDGKQNGKSPSNGVEKTCIETERKT